jgi:hypothetical protein
MSRMGLDGAAEANTFAGEVTVAPLPGFETVSGNDEPGGGGGSGAGGAGNGLAGVQIGVGDGEGTGLGDVPGVGEALGAGVGPPARVVVELLPPQATKVIARMIVAVIACSALVSRLAGSLKRMMDFQKLS